MILMKSCPRCNGDMMKEELLGEVEMVCLQCGHRSYPEMQTKRLAPAARMERKAA
jgi:DNA-directed RNA polymerase subunit M/transcription elongation factor TFIIS